LGAGGKDWSGKALMLVSTGSAPTVGLPPAVVSDGAAADDSADSTNINDVTANSATTRCDTRLLLNRREHSLWASIFVPPTANVPKRVQIKAFSSAAAAQSNFWFRPYPL
jgi:hypothetical protein